MLVTLSVSDLLRADAGRARRARAALRKRIAGTARAARHPLPGLRAGHQGRPARRLHGVLRRLGKDERDAGLGLHASRSTRRRRRRRRPTSRDEFAALETAPQRRACSTACRRSATCSSAPQLYAFPQQFATPAAACSTSSSTGVRAVGTSTSRRCCAASTSPAARRKARRSTACWAASGARFSSSARCCRRSAPSGKSFFLTRLLKEVVFQEAGLAGTNLRWERRRAALQAGAPGGAGAADRLRGDRRLGVSYLRNRALCRRGRCAPRGAGAAGRRARPGPQPTTCRRCCRCSTRCATLAGGAERRRAPLSMGFGLYQGDKLDAAAQRRLPPPAARRLPAAPRAAPRGAAAHRRARQSRAAVRGAEGLPDAARRAPFRRARAESLHHRRLGRAACRATLGNEQRARARTPPRRPARARRRAAPPLPADTQLVADARNAIAPHAAGRPHLQPAQAPGRGRRPARVHRREGRRAVGGAGVHARQRRAADQGRARAVQLRRLPQGASQRIGARRPRQLADEEGWVLGTAGQDRRWPIRGRARAC